MFEQNKKYYNRGNIITKDELFFKICNVVDHENKILVEKVKTINNKQFIKHYKLSTNELDLLIISLKKMNIKIISSISNDNSNLNIHGTMMNGTHPEYNDNNILQLESYRKTITAKNLV